MEELGESQENRRNEDSDTNWKESVQDKASKLKLWLNANEFSCEKDTKKENKLFDILIYYTVSV